jgi:hypothetical protein
MTDSVSTELADFIRHECGFSDEEEINSHTGMSRDLGVYGDDAVEFLVAYGAHFHVDVSGFMAADYFDGEGMDVLGGLLRAVGLAKSRNRKELTVGHLQRGIAAKRLDEQVIAGG